MGVPLHDGRVRRLLRLHAGLDGGHRGRVHRGPQNIATGLDSDGSELKAADVGFPYPRTTGAGSATSARNRRRPDSTGRSGCSSIGARRTTFSTSSGSRTSRTTSARAWRTSSTSSTPAAGRPAPAGRPFDQRTDLAVGARPRRPDAGGLDADLRRRRRQPGPDPDEIHQPDNLETRGRTDRDRGPGVEPAVPGHFQMDAATATTARLWRPVRGHAGVVARVDQADRTEIRGSFVDGLPAGQPGRVGDERHRRRPRHSGEGWFLIDVQAHTLWVAGTGGSTRSSTRPTRTSRSNVRAGSCS